MRAGSMPSSSHGDLQGDGVHALAHLGPAVAHLDACRRRAKRTTASAISLEPVAEPAVLQPEPEPDGLAGGDAPRRRPA